MRRSKGKLKHQSNKDFICKIRQQIQQISDERVLAWGDIYSLQQNELALGLDDEEEWGKSQTRNWYCDRCKPFQVTSEPEESMFVHHRDRVAIRAMIPDWSKASKSEAFLRDELHNQSFRKAMRTTEALMRKNWKDVEFQEFTSDWSKTREYFSKQATREEEEIISIMEFACTFFDW